MARLNRAMLIGNCGQDPDMKYTDAGTAILTFSIATNEGYYDKNSDEWVDKTAWHNLIAFGENAKRWAEKISKGTPMYAEGKLQTRKWQDKNDVTHYRTEILLSNIQILERKASEDVQAPPSKDEDNGDLPF